MDLVMAKAGPIVYNNTRDELAAHVAVLLAGVENAAPVRRGGGSNQ